MKPFNRVFVPNPNFRFPTEKLEELADQIVYISDRPIFDDSLENESYQRTLESRLEDFDCERDVIAFYGDPLIFAMAIFYLAEDGAVLNVARFSTKLDQYLVKKISD